MGTTRLRLRATLALRLGEIGSVLMRGVEEGAVRTTMQLHQRATELVEAEEGSIMEEGGGTEAPIRGVEVGEVAAAVVGEQEGGVAGITDPQPVAVTTRPIHTAPVPKIPACTRGIQCLGAEGTGAHS